jgi:peptide/nickel transport system substrate-binding protein
MKKTIFIGFILIIALFCLSGCSGITNLLVNSVKEPEPDLYNDALKVVREDEGPSQGGSLNLFMIYPDSLNPLISLNPTVRHLSFFVFDSLFSNEGDGTLKNILTDQYTISNDGLILDIRLKDEIFFHDGEPLSSDDVVYTIDAIKNAGQKSIYSNCISNIESVKSVDRLSLRIIFKKKDPQYLEKLIFPIVPQHVFSDWPAEGHDDSMKLIGTGPYKYLYYYNDEIKLIKNETWWNLSNDNGLNHPLWIDSIIFKVYLSDSDMIEAFQKQEIDIAWVEEGSFKGYSQRSDLFLTKYESNLLEYLVLSPNPKSTSPMSNKVFRDILTKYLNWYDLTKPVNEEQSYRYSFKNQESEENIMDRDEALDFLRKAGFTYQEDRNTLRYYRNGANIPVYLTFYYNEINEERKAICEWTVKALSDIGIQVISKPSSYDALQNTVKKRDFDIIALGCRIPLFSDKTEVPRLICESLNLSFDDNVVLPLYTKYGVVLYHNYIRGPRTPVWENIYNGWQELYTVKDLQ